MIKLNALERKLFDTFRAFLQLKRVDSTLRVAGGWVRDKLLGRDSTDIDIALDNCSGEHFAELFHAYLKEIDQETHGFGVIRKNPEKSKHLETATIQVFGAWIDFVNLRGEEYCEDSRIPKIVLGTPQSDAFRRDFTVNALFYNINEDKVEDFTKLGLSDLQQGIIRTPLEPLQTFLDDPLRILRGFRFAVRFCFKIDPLIFNALANPQVFDAFAKKISRERVGLEFTANFEKNPDLASTFGFFALIKQTGFWPLILGQSASNLLDAGYDTMARVAKALDSLRPDFEYTIQRLTAKDATRSFAEWELFQIALLSTFTLVWYDRKIKDPKKQMVFGLFTNGLKMPNRYAETAAHLQKSLVQLADMVLGTDQTFEDFAMWQRDCGAFWRLCERLYNLGVVPGSPADRPLALSQLFRDKNLEEFWDLRPLIDGKELGDFFGVSGPQIRAKQLQLLRWQAGHPLSSKDDFFKSHQKC